MFRDSFSSSPVIVIIGNFPIIPKLAYPENSTLSFRPGASAHEIQMHCHHQQLSHHSQAFLILRISLFLLALANQHEWMYCPSSPTFPSFPSFPCPENITLSSTPGASACEKFGCCIGPCFQTTLLISQRRNLFVLVCYPNCAGHSPSFHVGNFGMNSVLPILWLSMMLVFKWMYSTCVLFVSKYGCN